MNKVYWSGVQGNTRSVESSHQGDSINAAVGLLRRRRMSVEEAKERLLESLERRGKLSI